MAAILATLVSAIHRAGAWGILVYAAAYVLAATLLVPSSALTAAAGFVWGPVLGALVAWPVSVLASCAPFLLGRTLLRGVITRRLEQNHHTRARAIDAAVARKGIKVVALMRLSPVIPANVSNYALALSRISLRDYVLGTLAGSLPATALYAYLGSAARDIAELVSGTRTHATAIERALFWGGLAMTITFVVVITRVTRRELAREIG